MTPVEDEALRQEDVAAIGHDLRGPLSVIALEVAMLEDKLPSLSRDARAAIGRIGRNLTYLDHLLQDLLDLSAIDAARFQIHRETTELCSLAIEVVDRLVSTRDRGRVVVATCGIVNVLADAHRIERVVANLVHNALKYSARTTEVTVAIEARGELACVSVIDAGPGLAPDDMQRLFEKFRRAPATRHLDGSGLGLYVSRKIVEAHDGRLGVESVLGRGSRFFFELPLVDARTV